MNMDVESVFITLQNLSNYIYYCYKKLSKLEKNKKEYSLEYENTLLLIDELSILEDEFYNYINNNKDIAYVISKFSYEKIKAYKKPYFVLFHKFSKEELISMRIFNKIYCLYSDRELAKDDNFIGLEYSYISDKTHRLFLDILVDMIYDIKDNSSIKNCIIDAKNDCDFTMKDNNIPYTLKFDNDFDSSYAKCFIGELGRKLSNIGKKTIEQNYRSVILNVAYIRSLVISCNQNMIDDLIDEFQLEHERGNIEDTEGYDLFMDILYSKEELTEEYTDTDDDEFSLGLDY